MPTDQHKKIEDERYGIKGLRYGIKGLESLPSDHNETSEIGEKEEGKGDNE
jgi:hypothetical protein